MQGPQHLPFCVIVGALLVQVVQGGWIELYRDANHKHKLLRIDDVNYDQCYGFGCAALDNTITSAKWGGLSEKMVDGGDAMIAFYTDRACLERKVWWRIKTQSDGDLYFPSDFRLDGINDEISGFVVWHQTTKNMQLAWTDVCTIEAGELDTENNVTVSSLSGSGSGALDNSTVTASV